jgi:hypothetical protein
MCRLTTIPPKLQAPEQEEKRDARCSGFSNFIQSYQLFPCGKFLSGISRGYFYVSFSESREKSVKKSGNSKGNMDFSGKTKIMAGRQNIFIVKNGNDLI